MSTLMATILSLTLSGSLFIIILFLCKPLYKERFSRKWQYYIWLIVVMRLLLPFTIEVNLIGSFFHQIGQTSILTFTDNELRNPVSDMRTNMNNAVNNEQINIPILDKQNPSIFPQTDNVKGQIASLCPQNTQPSTLSTIRSTTWVLWMIVAIALFIHKITIYQRFVRYIKAGRNPVSDIDELERFGRMVEQNNIKKVVGFYTHNLISSPVLLGFFRPYIVLPTLNISESDFKYTILHELTHYKRGDMFYKWLVQLTICLHWFNPIVYMMGKEINKLCELSCDETVISNLDYQGMRAYGDTLLNAAIIGGKYKDCFLSVTLNSNKKILKERLDLIMKFRKKSKATIACAFIVTILLCAGITVAGAYNRSTSEETDVVSADNNSTQQTAPISDEIFDINPLQTASASGADIKPRGGFSSKVNSKPQEGFSSEANNEIAPLRIDFSGVLFQDCEYRWPNQAIIVTNISDKPIKDFTFVSLAYDKDGNPLELHWDALNVSTDGQIGSVGTGANGISHGIVVDIHPKSPKSYAFTRSYSIQSRAEVMAMMESEKGYEHMTDWLNDEEKIEEGLERENFIMPMQTCELNGWILFDGWNQSTGEHNVRHILSVIKQVTFEDGSVWFNSKLDAWLAVHEGRNVRFTAEDSQDALVVHSSSVFSQPKLGAYGSIQRNIEEGDKEAFAHFKEHGITIEESNIYYNGQLVREVIFYTTYESTGYILYRSSETSGNLLVYILLPGTPHSISGSDIENFICIDVVEDDKQSY